MPEMHGLGLDDLRVFCDTVRLGSFTAAATARHYTQSGVSRRIAALERASGGPLFVREARGVRLTPAGAALHRHAVEALARLDAVAGEMDAIRRGVGGRLRVGAFATATASLVPGALREFHRARPDVEVTAVEGLSGELAAGLRSGALDLAVLSDYPAGAVGGEDLELVPLCDDPLLVALPRDHPLAAAPALRLADLAGEPWFQAGGVPAGPAGGPGAPVLPGRGTGTGTGTGTGPVTPATTGAARVRGAATVTGARTGTAPEATGMMEAGTGTVLVEACRRAGFVPRIVADVRSWTGKLGFVAAGLGVTLVPGLVVGSVRADVVVRRLDDDLPPRRVEVAFPTRPEPLPSARHLADLLVAAARPAGG